jgi:hypothetical protein
MFLRLTIVAGKANVLRIVQDKVLNAVPRNQLNGESAFGPGHSVTRQFADTVCYGTAEEGTGGSFYVCRGYLGNPTSIL